MATHKQSDINIHKLMDEFCLCTYQEWIDMQDGTRRSTDREISKEGESIDEFSYQKYLCPELF